MSEIVEQSLEEDFAKAVSDDLKFACVAFRDSVKVTSITQKEIAHRLKMIYTPSQIRGLNRGLLTQLVFEELCVRRVYPQLKIAVEGQFTGQQEKIESVTLTIVNHNKNVEVI